MLSLREDSPSPVLRLVAKVRRKMFFREQWFLHVDRFGADPLNVDMGSGFDLISPSDRFWADPFLWFQDGRGYAFVEELPFATGKGHISVVPFDENGRILGDVPVLREPWHLSYPYLFEWDEKLWMLPEAGQSRRVTLYRCVRFPDQWVAETVLMDDVHGADPTLLEHGGLWWLFMTVAAGGRGLNERLCLFSAPSPLGPYTPHPKNPVVVGARGARPAGTPFRHGGALYRPAQDCTALYGKQIIVRRIDLLTPDDFVEAEHGVLQPGWRSEVLRTHHLCVKDGWRVVDALRHLRRGSAGG